MTATEPERGFPMFPAAAETYLRRVDDMVSNQDPREVAARIRHLVSDHDAWRARCLNMNPAESLISRGARELLDSDMATRLSEGVPGAKLYPHAAQNRHIDEIEATVIALARRQFGARFVEWRPVSTSMANAVAFFSVLRPGDVVLSQDEDGGGNYAYHDRGPIALTGARVEPMQRRGEAFEIDVDAVADQARRLRPRMLVVGGSNVLFPYPLRELREIADSVGAVLVYDAAHLGLLIAHGDFQRPLAEGAHLVIVSTHKIMGGPVGGLILTDDERLFTRISDLTFPGFMQTRDQNKFAALAVALAETARFGPQLAARMVANAQALAQALGDEGFDVIAADRGATRTHQIFLRLEDDARTFELRCQAANILLADCALSGDMALTRRTGARLATHELSRIGLNTEDMVEVAGLIARASRGEPSEPIAAAVEALLRRYPGIANSFDGSR